MRTAMVLVILTVGSLMGSEASAACAAFVCKHPVCRYRVESSAGPRVVNLAGGERRILSGLAGDAAYCDWAGGCVTPMRPVRSLGPC